MKISNKKIIKIERSDDDLIKALSDNLEILREELISVRAGDFKRIKIIKGVLRVLVYTSNSNVPLLIQLAKEYSIVPMINTDSPRGLFERTLDDYLKEICFGTGSSNTKILCNIDVISKSSQQEGLAHEDWEIDEDLYLFKGDGLKIGGMSVDSRVIVALASNILKSGLEVLQKINFIHQQKLISIN